MGCAPTAQRMSQIPSNNVLISSKSTKSTLKNSGSVLSPERINLKNDDDYGMRNRSNKHRFYSPRQIRRHDKQQDIFSPLCKVRNKLSYQQNKQKIHKNILEFNFNQTKSIDLISHLSLSSQCNNTKQQQINEVRKSIKKYPVIQRKSSKLQLKVSDQKTVKKKTVILLPNKLKNKTHKQNKQQHSNKKYGQILQAQLNGMNNEKFQRIDIQRMHF